MAEAGLLPFARIAVQVCRAVLPRYRSRFSKHQFTQPQLQAILCLMRYEDWTFREGRVGHALSDFDLAGARPFAVFKRVGGFDFSCAGPHFS
jgi:hypothetical protein